MVVGVVPVVVVTDVPEVLPQLWIHVLLIEGSLALWVVIAGIVE